MSILSIPSSLALKKFLLLNRAGPLAGANLPRIGALILILAYLTIVIAAYDATLHPGPLSLRVGRCAEMPCVIWVMPAGRAWQAGARPGMQVLSADGASVSDFGPGQLPLDPVVVAELRTSLGESLVVELEDQVIIRGTATVSLWLLGAMFAVLGAAVLPRRPDLTTARWFGAFTGFTAAAIAVSPASGGPHPHWSLVLQVLTMVGIGATCLPFVDALVADENRRKRFLLSAAFAAVATFLVATYGISVAAAPTLYEIVRPAVFLFVIMSLFGAVGLLAVSSRRQRSSSRRQQSQIALFGIGLGTLPVIGLTLIPEAMDWGSFVPAHIFVLAVGLIPAAFAYAILQHNLLGIRRLVHRGMVYGIASATTLALILIGLTVVASSDGGAPGEVGSVLLEALLLTAGVALFFPARRGARWLVDRFFYWDVTPYEEFVDSVQLGQVAADPADEIITGIAGRLVDALHLESAVLFLGTGPSNARLLTAVGPRAEEVVSRIYPGVVS